MTDPPPIPGTGDGRSPLADREVPTLPVWPLLLGTAALLLAVIALHLIVEDRRDGIRSQITDSIVPARGSAQALQTALARQAAALRGYLLTGDQMFLSLYAEAAAAERRRLDELLLSAAGLGGEWPDKVEQLMRESMAWHARLERTGLLERNDPPGTDRRLAIDPFAHYRLNALAVGLHGDLVRLENAYWADLARSDRLEVGLTVALVLLALATAFFVGLASRRAHRLASYHGRRVREEQEFRRLAAELAAASGPDELAGRLLEGLCTLTDSTTAFVEHILPGRERVVVAAAEGVAAAYRGETGPYQGSLTQRLRDSSDPIYVGAVERIESPIASRLASSCRGCAAVAMSLVADDRGLGAIVLVREPGRRSFGASDIARIRIVGQFASLAIFRVLALKEAEQRELEEAASAAEAERRREQTERTMKGRAGFIRGFSHDLKNPLGAVIGYADLLESGVQGELSPDQQKSVHRIGQAARTALRLISDLVDLSRAEAGELRVEPGPTVLADIVREVVEEYRAQAESAGLELQAPVRHDLPAACADPDRVRQILGNLLSNAIKYTDHGRVTVSTDERTATIGRRTGRWLVVDVADTGPGIPEAARERIFEEFSRLESTDEKSGTGLGLAISRRVARIMEGDITVESEPGRGSSFTLWLRPVGPWGCMDAETDDAPG